MHFPPVKQKYLGIINTDFSLHLSPKTYFFLFFPTFCGWSDDLEKHSALQPNTPSDASKSDPVQS